MLEILADLDEIIESKMEAGLKIAAADCGLDKRCGYVWLFEDCIMCREEESRLLNYYGGFEYIEKEYVHNLGSFVIYEAEHTRVSECILWYNTHNKGS